MYIFIEFVLLYCVVLTVIEPFCRPIGVQTPPLPVATEVCCEIEHGSVRGPRMHWIRRTPCVTPRIMCIYIYIYIHTCIYGFMVIHIHAIYFVHKNLYNTYICNIFP